MGVVTLKGIPHVRTHIEARTEASLQPISRRPTMLVYLITSKDTGRVYVGQTVRPLHKRMYRHWEHARRGRMHPLYAAIRKYGESSFSVRVLEVVTTQEELDSAERKWVLYFNSVHPEGYNLRGGGRGRGEISKDTLQRMSESHKGFVVKEDTKEKIRAAMKVRFFSPEHRARISAAKKGKKVPSMLGKLSGEASHFSKHSWEVVNAVRLDYASGGYRQFELSKKYGIKAASLCMILSGKTWKTENYHAPI